MEVAGDFFDGEQRRPAVEAAAENLLTKTEQTACEPASATATFPLDASGRNRPAFAGPETLEWDAGGNLVRKGNQRFQYDYKNRLTVVTDLAGSVIASYAYDTENRRVRKTVGATTTETVWDGWEPIEEYRNGQLTSRRLFGPQLGELVRLESDLDGNGSLEQTYLPVFDVLGNLAELRREDGDLVERYEYSPFGQRRVVPAGTSPCEWIDQSAAGNGFGFHGLMEDDETGLLYARNRFFDPEMGRFVSMDPLGYVDGPNAYAYGMNSPANYEDRMGLAVGDYWDPRSYTDLSLYNSPASGRFWQQSGEFAAGEGKGLALALPRAAVGLFQMATHPIQTFKTLAPLNNPIVAALVAHQMAEGYTNKTAFEQGDAFGETVLFGGASFGFGFTAQGAAVSARVGSAARAVAGGAERTLARVAPALRNISANLKSLGLRTGAHLKIRRGLAQANNSVPERVARVLEERLIGRVEQLAPPGAPDAFVAAADDIVGLTSSEAIAQRLLCRPSPSSSRRLAGISVASNPIFVRNSTANQRCGLRRGPGDRSCTGATFYPCRLAGRAPHPAFGFGELVKPFQGGPI